MKYLIAILFVLSVYANAATAQDLDKGREAFESADFATVFDQLLPLAEQGNPEAQFFVHIIYSNGDAVPQDNNAAMKWLKSAANLGLGNAQFSIGRLYFGGSGVPQDSVLAYMWLNLASGAQMWLPSRPKDNFELTGTHAASLRDLIAKDMSRAEIKEAQRRTRDWLDAHPQ